MTAVQVLANVMMLDGYIQNQPEIQTLLAFTLILTLFEVKHVIPNGTRSTLGLIVIFLTWREAVKSEMIKEVMISLGTPLMLILLRSTAYSIAALYVYFKLLMNFLYVE